MSIEALRRSHGPRGPRRNSLPVLRHTIGLLFLTAIDGGSSALVAQRPLNLDFERPSVSYPDLPWGWTLGWSAFTAGPAASFDLDSNVRHRAKKSLRIAASDSTAAAPPHAIILQLPADFFRGRDVQLTGWFRTSSPRARALITLEAWKDRAFAAADTARSDTSIAAAAVKTWTKAALRIEVPNDPTIHSLVITVALDGRDTVWFDDFSLSVDGASLTSLPTTAQPPTQKELAWLKLHGQPLRSVGVSKVGANDDLSLFGRIVGDARVVGLGESTHGTREFFQVKHRLLEYLVRELGFTVFAIEGNQLAVEKVNAYVQTGIGTAPDAMRVMFRVWNTEEMLGLVEWMRAYNAAHPDNTVRFVGYDMQDHRTPTDSLRAFLERVDPAFLTRFDTLTSDYRAQSSYATPQVADTVRARWARQADTLWQTVSGRESAWLARAATHADTIAAKWAVQDANLLRQAARFNVALSSPERDSLMAANFDWALRTLSPGARAVVWAHDVHVSRGGDSTLSFNGGAQMGAYLRALGHSYRAFTLLTDSGWYSATRSFSDHRMIEAATFPAPPGSIEAALHQLGRPVGSVGWVVDLRTARTDGAADWLRRPRPIRHIGYAAYDYGFELSAVLPLEFDGAVFIDQTTASRLLK